MPRRKSRVLPYDPHVVRLLGLPKRTRPTTVKRVLKEMFRTRCKPCWELKYCPYGPLVEQFPLPRIIRADAVQHNEFLKQQLKADAYDASHKRMSSAQVKNFNPR